MSIRALVVDKVHGQNNNLSPGPMSAIHQGDADNKDDDADCRMTAVQKDQRQKAENDSQGNFVHLLLSILRRWRAIADRAFWRKPVRGF